MYTEVSERLVPSHVPMLRAATAW